MKNTKIFLITALLGSVMAGCQTEIEVEPVERPVVKQTVMLTVQASKGVDTKALIYDSDNNKWNAVWADDEKVDVYIAGVTAPQGTLTASTTDGSESVAILSGEIEVENLNEGENILTLLFPGREDNKWTYEGQDGTTPDGDMASLFDYAMATLTVIYDPVSGTLTPSGSAAFANQQSIYRLRFKDNGTYFNVSSISLVASQNKIVRSRSYVDNAWTSACGVLTMDPTVTPENNLYYMAIRNEYKNEDPSLDPKVIVDNYTFTVVRKTDNAVFEGTKGIPAGALAGPSYIPTSVAVTQKTLEQASGTISNASDVL